MLLTTGLIWLSDLCILICAFKEGGRGFFWMSYLICFLWIIKLQCFSILMMFFWYFSVGSFES
jgi:hypothetical protein